MRHRGRDGAVEVLRRESFLICRWRYWKTGDVQYELVGQIHHTIRDYGLGKQDWSRHE